MSRLCGELRGIIRNGQEAEIESLKIERLRTVEANRLINR